jgi:hypothetical protein
LCIFIFEEKMNFKKIVFGFGLVGMLLGASDKAFACQPCHEVNHWVCGLDPKRPNCHNVTTCEGGNCGLDSQTNSDEFSVLGPDDQKNLTVRSDL